MLHELNLTDLKYDGPKNKTHYNPISFGFDFDLQMQAINLEMFFDQSDFILNSISTFMNNRANRNKNFTIIAHSVGCLQSLMIESSLPDRL